MRAGRGELPGGTVTFLFTDIEGSTKALHELGPEEYESALAEHRRALRETFARFGGIEVDTQGDAFFIAFPDAADAVLAAAEAQRALAGGRVRVRMGVHTGTPRLTAEGYVGHDVHLGARIAAAGHGGQVLMSKQARGAAGGTVETVDLGEHRVKDFAEPVWIYQLGADRFPPLKTISNTNLPRPASSFVGRDREVAEIRDLLRDGVRMLTLTGPGGTGKTRLAIESAAELVPAFRNGVFWVPLAAVRDPALVGAEISHTVGAKNGLADHIEQREMLLVIDNFEQVADAAPEIGSLLSACPNLAVLLTSRELLRVNGEIEYAVPPLTDDEAVNLFRHRSGLGADSAIGELCRRLDNLPLGVELAAARTSILTPMQILGRLSQRLDLLKGGRDAEARQKTLRATIEWSYELLSSDDKQLFAQLSAFRGGCTLDAAQRVADADLDVLQSLVDKSLVRHTGERFWMLETIREFAAEKLEQSGDTERLLRRHADFYIRLAEEAEPALFRDDTGGWSDRLETELDNFRGALEWLSAARDADGAQRLAGALNEFWCTKNHVPEGRRLIESALDMPGPTGARAKALVAAAHMARDAGDPQTATMRAQEGLTLYREAGDVWRAAYARFWLGASLADATHFARAKPMFQEAAEAFAELGDDEYALLARRFVAWMHDALGDRTAARALHEENLGRIRALGYRQLEATTLGALGSYAVDEGRVGDALELSTAALAAYSDLGSLSGVANELYRCAGAFSIAGKAGIAARLLACAEAMHDELGLTILPHLVAENAAAMARIRDQLDEAALANELAQGRSLAPEQAVALALGNAR